MSTEHTTPANDANLSALGRELLDTGGSKPSGPWVPPTAEELHELLPEYDIVKILGRGGMGAVYMGRQTSLDRLVAIKILSAALEENDRGFIERFKNEARALGKLNHPGIVGVYDFGTAPGGLLYIVMEYVDGTDVARMIAQQGKLPPEHAMAITAHVCDAIGYAHERGIIHRDIKPANIMVGYDGVVKVADFGLAKMSHGGESGLTQSGMAMGTLHYMAPEALTLGSAVDHRADIYAVGVMLFQMLTGKLPQGLFDPPSTQVAGVDGRYDRIVMKAICNEREARYQRTADLRADLDEILTRPVVKVVEGAAMTPAALPTQARPRREAPQSATHSTRRVVKGRADSWLLRVAVASAALAFGTILWVAKRDPGGQTADADPPKTTVVDPVPKVITPIPVEKPPAVAAVPDLPAPPVPSKPTPAPALAPADGKSAEWMIPFFKEVHESQAPVPKGRLVAKEFNYVEADETFGVLSWLFADPRLADASFEITEAVLRFHVAKTKLAMTKHQILVSLNDVVIGSRTGAESDSWVDVPLDPRQIPRQSTSFELVMRCGADAVVVHNKHSAFQARLVLNVRSGASVGIAASATKPAASSPPPAASQDLSAQPGFRACIASYQKARQAQLADLLGKYRQALSLARQEAAGKEAAGRLAEIDTAIQHADKMADMVELNLTSLEVKPLPKLPPLADQAPIRLQELRAIYDRETEKIEASLAADLVHSLQEFSVSSATVDASTADAVRTFGKMVAGMFPTFAQVPPSPPAAVSPVAPTTGGSLVFSDDFNSAELAKDWLYLIKRTDSSITPDTDPAWGRPRAALSTDAISLREAGDQGFGCWLTRPLPERTRIEFTAMLDTPASVMVCEFYANKPARDESPAGSGYRLMFGNTGTSPAILRGITPLPGQATILAQMRPAARTLYQMVIQRADGRTIEWFVDGVLCARAADASPKQAGYLGFHFKGGTVWHDDLRIYNLGSPQ